MIRLIIVEDQTILLDALADSLSMVSDISVVARTSKSSEVLSLCERHKPDLLLMDIYSDGGNTGISETIKVKAKMPDIKILLMTAMPDLSFIHDAKEAGADSFVYKNVGKEELVERIRQTMQDYRFFPPEETTYAYPDFELTDREMEILRLVCAGKSRKEISDTLFLAENTIRNHVNRVLAKTGYDSIAQLAIFAVSKGYIVPDIDTL